MTRADPDGAADLALFLLATSALLHSMVIVGLVPARIVWGGRTSSRSRVRVLETVSMTANLLALWLVSMEAGYTERRLSDRTLRACLRGFAALFALNTVGNLLSTSRVERVLFTPITLLLAYLFSRLASA